MPVPKKILNHLDNNKVKYEVLEHKTVYTASDKAGTLHTDPKAVAKTAVLKMDNKDYAIALVPADKLLDKQKIKKAINTQRKKSQEKAFKKVDFANERWMNKNIDGKVGATPPFGQIWQLPTLVDNTLLKQKKVFVNGGDYNTSIQLTNAAFTKSLGDFLKGSFSAAKPKKKKKVTPKKKPKKKTTPKKKTPARRKTTSQRKTSPKKRK